MKKWTKLVNFDDWLDDPYHSASMPIYQTATFVGHSINDMGKYHYTRSGNPTRTVVEKQIATLENGKHAFAFSSGMAAINALTGLLKPGEHIIAANDIYGGTYRLLTQRLEEHYNIGVSFVDITNLKEIENAFSATTKMLILETPSNPLQKIANLKLIAAITHKHKALFAVDNSFMSPWLQQPLEFGADIVVHSATKFLSGHSDATGGFLIVNKDGLAQKIAFIQNAEGAALAPFECWLISRGIKTLGLRIERQQSNAHKVLEHLQTEPLITQLYYPSLLEDASFKLHTKQTSGYGSIICIATGNSKLSEIIANTTKLFKLMVSFGSIHSSISIPTYMSHLAIPSTKQTMPSDLIRLSIGIEDPEDLIADLKQAFKNAQKQVKSASKVK